MEFKIDTKPSYVILTPVSSSLDANLTDAIRQKWETLAESGSSNLILDMQNCTVADETAYDDLLSLHEFGYENGRSFVITGLQNEVAQSMKEKELHHTLNIAPTIIEAVDIVSMEILERDLFNEES